MNALQPLTPPPRRPRPCAPALVLCALPALLASGATALAQEKTQEPNESLRRALAAEARQVALIERIAPAVAAVFPGEEPAQGGGSGVIIDRRGYVLTNFHVSGLAPVLTIGLDDGRTYRARLLGIDPGGDIALLKLVEDRVWPWVPRGRSDDLRPGERVFALGNPFLLAEDFAPTVTEGVVSGIHRYRAAASGADLVYGDCIQIDASINPGNSGGPLFDAAGRLVGINGLGGFRPDRGRVNVGVGFAASIDQIEQFLPDLRAGRHCQHGTMNATVRDQEGDEGRATRIVVDAIVKSSNAYRAGLRIGDVVQAFEGRPLSTQNQLLTRISRLPAGRRITLQVQRAREDGRGAHELELSFRLEPLWAGPEQGAWRPDPRLVAAETEAIVSGVRAAAPQAWVREGTIELPGGGTDHQVLRFAGGRLRLERGARGRQEVEVYAGGEGWRQGADGQVTDLAPERRDQLGGTAELLGALLTGGPGQAGVSALTFTGGEQIGDVLALRLESRDRAGRERRVYVHPESFEVLGIAFPADPGRPDGRWIEELFTLRPGAGPLVRREYDDGRVLERGQATLRAEAQPDALFARPAGEDGR